jgi:hypothetical protein
MTQAEFYNRYRTIANIFNSKTAKLPRNISKTSNPSLACKELLEAILDHTSKPSESSKTGQRKYNLMTKWRQSTIDINIPVESVQIGN